MKYIQLFKDGSEIIASDGIMLADGRFNIGSIKQLVINRNNRFKTNFPHKVADSFAIYSGRIGSALSKQYFINCY